jgi:hypothetical protein
MLSLSSMDQRRKRKFQTCAGRHRVAVARVISTLEIT